jgi:hypothetical protein
MKQEIFIWSSSISEENGEGRLARLFLKKLKSFTSARYKFIFLNKKKENDGVYHRYLQPFLGVMLMWKYSVLGKKICYINYLPLWNFFLFLFLPRATILGPITGSFDKKKNTSFLRKRLMPFFFHVSYEIIKIRFNLLLQALDNFKKIDKKKIFISNFQLLHLYRKKLNTDKIKDIDLIVYLRTHKNKNYTFQKKVLLYLLRDFKNLKILIFGSVFRDVNNKNFTNYKKLGLKKIFKYIRRSKFSLIGEDNIYSFFSLDSILSGNYIFYSNKLKEDKNFLSKSPFIKLSFNNAKKVSNEIKFRIKKYVKIKENETIINYNYLTKINSESNFYFSSLKL